MHNPYILAVALATILANAPPQQEPDRLNTHRREIEQVEQAFAEMAQSRSVRAAFLEFAAPEAVLLRGKRLVRGREQMAKWFDEQPMRDIKLNWKPDYIDVSQSGDLAYTFGTYTLTAKDPQGQPIRDEGIFHTVWKRQPDGSWKFVWD